MSCFSNSNMQKHRKISLNVIHFEVYVHLSFMFCQVGLHATQAMVRDLFERKDLGLYKDSFKAVVNPTGVMMVKLTPA